MQTKLKILHTQLVIFLYLMLSCKLELERGIRGHRPRYARPPRMPCSATGIQVQPKDEEVVGATLLLCPIVSSNKFGSP